MKDQDQVVSCVVVAVDDQIIETVDQLLAFQLALPQTHEKLLSAAGSFLLQWDIQCQQIVSDIAGEHFFRNLQIFIELFIFQI